MKLHMTREEFAHFQHIIETLNLDRDFKRFHPAVRRSLIEFKKRFVDA